MILVTGGTGLVGSHLLYFLLKENTKVRAIHRKNSNIRAVKKIFALYTAEVDSLFNKIEWFEADTNDIPALSEAFTNVTHVYHCAAHISFDPSKYKTLKKINVEGTANVVNLCLANNIKKLCYVSSIATLGSSVNGKLVNEETSWNPNDKNSVYAITKYGAEIEVWRGTQEGLDAVIVNPGVILGISPKDSGSSALISVAAKGTSYYPSGSIGIVDVIDVVKAMTTLMNSEIKNEQYILVSENIAIKELLSKFSVHFKKKPPSKKLSKKLMYFLCSLDWLSSKIFGTKRKITRATVRSMYTKSAYDAAKIQKALNFQFTPSSETINRIAGEYLDATPVS